MKQLFLTLSICLLSAVTFGQNVATKPKTAPKTGTGTKTRNTPQSHVGQCYADKTWKLQKIEKFAIEKAPGDDQKNDMLLLNGDGTFKVVLKGVEKTGTYSKSGSWLNLKPNDGSEAMPYKIESCEGSTLKADWRDGDTHNHFTYGL